jgi:hypothetical protein
MPSDVLPDPALPVPAPAAVAPGDAPPAPAEDGFLSEETRIGIGAPIDRERLRRLAEAAAHAREEEERPRDTIPDGLTADELRARLEARASRAAEHPAAKDEPVEAEGSPEGGPTPRGDPRR